MPTLVVCRLPGSKVGQNPFFDVLNKDDPSAYAKNIANLSFSSPGDFIDLLSIQQAFLALEPEPLSRFRRVMVDCFFMGFCYALDLNENLPEPFDQKLPIIINVGFREEDQVLNCAY